ncbi:H/ACA ribonucleoprotein complex non-core subunit NAF1 [Anolis carolinensis]|uniref:H/ACA ribonucleoprotein complex non-core subunit NAF1 n=1 Tax=Anolis carolinensis TaxID=28377 RepID=UPI002F2B1F8F
MEEAEEEGKKEEEEEASEAFGGSKVAEQLRALSVAAEGAVREGGGEKAAPPPDCGLIGVPSDPLPECGLIGLLSGPPPECGPIGIPSTPPPECGPIGIPSGPQELPEGAGASLDGESLPAVEEGAPPLGKGPSFSQSEETERRVGLEEGAELASGPKGEGESLAPGPRSPSQPQLDVNGGSDQSTVMEISGSASSESESDTDSDSSSSDSSSSSCLPILSEDDDDDDQQNKNEDNTCSTTKNGELPKESLCIEDLKIILPESVELMPIGKVSSIIGHLVIVESQKGMPPVNEDTVLFRGDHHSIGKIFEVFGPVSHPFYVLQFNNPEHIEAKGIKVHDAVYFAPSVESFTQYIFPEKLKQEKGSDASWKNDEEPPPEVLDYSDDEKERTAKQQKKSQNLKRKKFKSQQNNDKNGIDYQPRQRYYPDWREPHSTFSRGRYPHPSASPRFFRHQGSTPQQYYSNYAEPSAFHQQQRPDNSRRHQFSFPPPSFAANFAPSPRPATWGWPPGYTQNTYDPLLSLLSLPPPPPPPLPPPSAPVNSINPP